MFISNTKKQEFYSMSLFITFEGPDGAGKSTQISRLCAAFDTRKWPYLLTREPGGTPLAEHFRNQVKHYHASEPMTVATELLLFAASRSQHVENFIKPNLKKGNIIICDRFADSTTAYQGYGREIELDFVQKLNRFVTQGLVPDVTILLDLDPEIGLHRAANRESADRMEEAGLAFHKRVRAGFLQIAQKEPNRFIIVDATLPADDIHAQIMEQMKCHLPA